jgi:integrase
LDGSKIDAFLLVMAKDGKSPRTRNSYRQAMLALCSWLVKKGKLSASSLEGVSRAETRQVRKRRALSVGELRRLPEAASTRNRARALLYRLAIYTGLRKKELKALLVRMLHLDETPYHLRLSGEFTKNKQEAILPIPDGLAEALREHCRNKVPSSTVIRVASRLNVRFRKDLKVARIAYKDEAGAYADFHSLRKCTATLLALGGVHPKIAQQFLRHSSIELTMGVYTDARLMPLADAVKALPIL